MKKVFALVDLHPEFGFDDDGEQIVHGYFYEGSQLNKIKQVIGLLDKANYEHYQDLKEKTKFDPYFTPTEKSMNEDLEFWIDFVENNFERVSVKDLVA